MLLMPIRTKITVCKLITFIYVFFEYIHVYKIQSYKKRDYVKIVHEERNFIFSHHIHTSSTSLFVNGHPFIGTSIYNY